MILERTPHQSQSCESPIPDAIKHSNRELPWLILIGLLSISCAPSITSSLDLESPKRTPSAPSGERFVERAVKVAPMSSTRSISSENTKSTSASKERPFSPSDRIWGSMLLPAQTVKRLRNSLSSSHDPFTLILYGDSHTQGGYLGSSIAETLERSLNPKRAPKTSEDSEVQGLIVSPGFVTVDHPIKSAAEVQKIGFWVRQNWLYRGDQGSFGPLGIAFATQDKNAEMHVSIKEHRGVKVTAYFEKTGTELPFCLIVEQDPSHQRCHEVRPLGENESALGSVSVTLEPEQSVKLSLSKGYHISESLIRKRARSRKALKRKRSRIKKRYSHKERARRLKQIKAPSYAADSRLIYPDRAHLQLFGFSIESIKPKEKEGVRKVQVHSMGVRGATIWSPAKQSDETLSQWVQSQNPQVVATWFGTNTAARESGSLAVYEERFRDVLKRLKSAAPRAVCVVITPPDFGRRNRDCFLSKRDRRLLKRKSKRRDFLERLSKTRHMRVCDPDSLINQRKRGRHRFPVPEVRTERQWTTYKESCHYRPPAQLIDLNALQRRVALSEGCVVFDTLSEMGGVGSIKKWACTEPDRWAQLDLVHLSAKGYELLGSQIAKGLLSSLDDTPTPPIPLSTQLDLLDEQIKIQSDDQLESQK